MAAAHTPPADRAAAGMAPPPVDVWHHALQRFALRGLVIVGIGVGVALLLTLDAPPLQRQLTLLYTVCITLGCWFCVDGGITLWQRHAARRPGADHAGWPRWPVLALLLPLGTALGYSAGHAVANALAGRDDPALLAALLAGRPHTALALLLLAMLPGVVAVLYFQSREHLAASRAQALAAERAATDARLQVLLTQLEPHMLFNTLATLRALIAHDPPQAQAMLDRLVAYLRATLVASRLGAHTLADEFERLGDNLALMALRMGPRLAVRLDLPADLRQLPVPALLLQPLVENALRHGLEPKVGGGRIEVAAQREGGTLVLTVRDTGVGLAVVDDLRPAGAADAALPGTGFGTRGLRERLAALHGNAASLQLRPAHDAEGGCVATVTLPLASSG